MSFVIRQIPIPVLTSPHHFCDPRQGSLQTLRASGRVKWEPPVRGNLKLHNYSLSSVRLGRKEKVIVFRPHFPFTEPTSGHLMLGHVWGQELTSDPQSCLLMSTGKPVYV